jgi:hypothetical protein
MLEDRGVATVAIGLVRPHMEKTGGPRGLWVPFPLGRPLGEPEDAAFQRRVLRAALSLFERADGPLILEAFAEDAPSQHERAGWSPPFALPVPVDPASPAAWAAALRAEMALVRPWADRAHARFGRTTVGVSAQAPEAWPAYAAAFLAGELPAPPAPLPSPALALRFVADDLKAYYMEAAQADGGAPSIDQINAWLFRETVAGRFLAALRRFALASENAALKAAGGRFLVPAQWVPKEN